MPRRAIPVLAVLIGAAGCGVPKIPCITQDDCGGRACRNGVCDAGGNDPPAKPLQLEVERLVSLPAGGLDTNEEGPSYAGFAVGSKGYVVNSMGTNYEYDSVEGTWTKKAALGGDLPRRDAYGFTVGSLGYIAFGRSSGNDVYGYYDLWSYDPVQDSWSEIQVEGIQAGHTEAYQPTGTVLSVGQTIFLSDGWYPVMYVGSIDSAPLSGKIPLGFAFDDVAYAGSGCFEEKDGCTGQEPFYRLDPRQDPLSAEEIGHLPQGLIRQPVSSPFVIGTRAFLLDGSKAWIFSREDESWSTAELTAELADEGPPVASFTIGEVAYLLFEDARLYSLRVTDT
jgi:hypothetical protein